MHGVLQRSYCQCRGSATASHASHLACLRAGSEGVGAFGQWAVLRGHMMYLSHKPLSCTTSKSVVYHAGYMAHTSTHAVARQSNGTTSASVLTGPESRRPQGHCSSCGFLPVAPASTVMLANTLKAATCSGGKDKIRRDFWSKDRAKTTRSAALSSLAW